VNRVHDNIKCSTINNCTEVLIYLQNPNELNSINIHMKKSLTAIAITKRATTITATYVCVCVSVCCNWTDSDSNTRYPEREKNRKNRVYSN